IDNTGVQVADVVVGFLHLQKRKKGEIAKLIAESHAEPGDFSKAFDYYCWDLYARVSQWYEEDKSNEIVRRETLHAMEQGGNEASGVAELIWIPTLRRHLEPPQPL